MTTLNQILSVALSAAPWLLLGLFAAGLIKALIPEPVLQRWVGGRGIGGISRAAIIGAPLPLCSCGAIPTALALHRGGAGRGPTTAFLIGTPGIGVDSIAITYGMLGPLMALARAAGAVVTAIATGLLVATTGGHAGSPRTPGTHCTADCNAGTCKDGAEVSTPAASLGERLQGGIRYAFTDLLDDISTWVLIGLVLAGVLVTFIPPQSMAVYGQGLPAMLLMAFIGIPLYICATAATPIAAGMMMAGTSPGTVLVFLLAGPITSLATLGVLRRDMGSAALVCYLFGILATTVAFGLLVDRLAAWSGVDVIAQMGTVREVLPIWFEWSALMILVMLALRPLRRAMMHSVHRCITALSILT